MADRMLGRCGAGTVMETAAVGLPAVFVPTRTATASRPSVHALVVEAGGGLLLTERRLHLRMGGERDPGTARRPGTPAGIGDALAGVAGPTPRRCWRGTLEVIG